MISYKGRELIFPTFFIEALITIIVIITFRWSESEPCSPTSGHRIHSQHRAAFEEAGDRGRDGGAARGGGEGRHEVDV